MILTVIQARSDSTRLPGKIYLQIAGKSLLQHIYHAAPEPKVIAIHHEDTRLADYCKSKELNYVRCYAAPDDVLGRFIEAVASAPPPAPLYVLRLTADCPVLRANHIRKFLSLHQQHAVPENVILTNRPYDSDGFDMELFSVRALQAADERATDASDREHVTPWMYRHLHVIRVPTVDGKLWDCSMEKVSVDTPEEYIYVKQLLEDNTNERSHS